MRRLILWNCLLLAGVMSAAGAAVAIRNDRLECEFDTTTGQITLFSLSLKQPILREGTLLEAGGTARRAAVEDKVLGRGQAIEITQANGNTGQLLLFHQVPFLLVRAALRNGYNELVVTNQVKALRAKLECGFAGQTATTLASARSAGLAEGEFARLRVLGTGGLFPLTNAPGSYMWLAVAEAASRSGVVAGWLTSERGSGVVFARVTNGQARLEAQLDYGRLRIKPGQSETLETFAIGFFDDARFGLEAWADLVAKLHGIKLHPQPVGYCTWYSRPHGGSSDEKSIAELAAFAATNLAPYGFSVVQIDDGWQAGFSTNGPRRNFSAHAPNGPFPSGMKATADAIKALGLVPGIWFMPFAGTYYDPFFKEHQDWFVKREDGKPYETAWGGTCLDMTHPGARAYLSNVVRRIAHEWGYGYFKMDGLWTGTATKQIYVNSSYKFEGIGDAVFSNPDVCNIEAYRSGLRLVREVAGDRVFILGCCAPQNMRSYGGAFGLVDAMRIGPDNGSDWNGLLRGPIFGSRNYFLNGRVWYNDPDPVYVRPEVPLAQAQLICSWVNLSGQMNLSSEWLPGLPAERLDILRRTMPNHGLQARPVDLFEHEPARIWVVSDSRHQPARNVIGLFNWEKTELMIDCPLEQLGLSPKEQYAAYDYWANTMVFPFRGRLQQRLPPQSCRILSVQPVTQRPVLLSTSRHVTQGIVDVKEDVWDAKTQALSGFSYVMGGEPYELRLLTVSIKGRHPLEKLELSPADRAIGVTAGQKESGGLLRITLLSPSTRAVNWRVTFGKPQKTNPLPNPVANLKAVQSSVFAPVELSWEGDAPFYEVRRGTNLLSAGVSGTCYADFAAPAGASCQYTVTPLSFEGVRGTAQSVMFKVELPDPGPVPPAPEIPLSELKPIKATVGWGKLGVNKSIEGKALRVAGRTYASGLGVHANSEVVYTCAPEYRRFVAVAGLDEEKRDDERPSVIFEVYADKKLLAASPVLKWTGVSHWHFDLKLPEKTKIVRLVVNDAGDGVAADHADWVNAGFRRE